ncbi:MAG: hypothetical protein IJ515_07350 [Clostridia bacterium]|nr:hypothetical protein [Clostridia bacterium]
MKNSQKLQRYFAAANGYSGFRSYFNDVFSPFEFSNILILKGGPGTGKSSIMKKLISEFEHHVDSIEAIHCSSDPESLDGIILEHNGSMVAVIDGTAPHMTDPQIPGASEEIVNLGVAWNKELLKNNRQKIEKHSVLKSDAYKSAYSHLFIAGEINSLCYTAVEKMYDKDDSEIISSLSSNATGGSSIKRRLISSYGKNGFTHLETLYNFTDKIYTPIGIYGSEYVFMNHLFASLKGKGADMIVCPSPLDANKIEGIYIYSAKTAVVAEKESAFSSGIVIDTAQFLNGYSLSNERNNLEFFRREREIWLWNAAEQFKIASDVHFELEDIYTAAMNFKAIDEIFESVASEIKKTLSIN